MKTFDLNRVLYMQICPIRIIKHSRAYIAYTIYDSSYIILVMYDCILRLYEYTIIFGKATFYIARYPTIMTALEVTLWQTLLGSTHHTAINALKHSYTPTHHCR